MIKFCLGLIYFHDRHRFGFFFLIEVLVQRIDQLLQVDICLGIAQGLGTWSYMFLHFLLKCIQLQQCPVVLPPSSNQMVAKLNGRT